MRIVIFLFLIYFACVNCKNVNIEMHQNKTSNLELPKPVLGATEGGTVLSNSSRLVLPKNSVTPRKEANYNFSKEESTLTATDDILPVKIDTSKNKTESLNNESLLNQTRTAAPLSILETNSSSLNKSTAKENDTMHLKKPLVLSYKALEMASRTNEGNDLILQTDNLSPKTTITDQVPLPIENKPASDKVHPMQSSRHPDMIMPVVITILVVPMFAVLGYMVLRRGREAWKNRHYKRMDFLLDGMYND